MTIERQSHRIMPSIGPQIYWKYEDNSNRGKATEYISCDIRHFQREDTQYVLHNIAKMVR